MKAQLLMCIATVFDRRDRPVAERGLTYTQVSDTKCVFCLQPVVAVAEVPHANVFGPCIPGDGWLPAENFVPLNDPKLREVPETYDTKTPVAA